MEPDDEVTPEPEKKHRSPWMWVSGALAIVVIGLLAWGLSVKSDRDSAQDDLASTQKELDSTKQKLDSAAQATPEPAEDDSDAGRAVLAGGALAGMKAVYDDLADQHGATQEDLESTQADLDAANKEAEQAEKEATESRATIAKSCAKAYVGALGPLFEGDDPEAQADAVREQVAGITDGCKSALGGK